MWRTKKEETTPSWTIRLSWSSLAIWAGGGVLPEALSPGSLEGVEDVSSMAASPCRGRPPDGPRRHSIAVARAAAIEWSVIKRADNHKAVIPFGLRFRRVRSVRDMTLDTRCLTLDT